MSNLKLPTMTHSNLSAMLKGRASLKLAYQTHAVLGVNTGLITVTHHGNSIAALASVGGVDTAIIGNAGWHTRTTADRLNRIMRDNGIPYGVRIVQGDMTLFHIVNGSFDRLGVMNRSIVFNRKGGESWKLLD